MSRRDVAVKWGIGTDTFSKKGDVKRHCCGKCGLNREIHNKNDA